MPDIQANLKQWNEVYQWQSDGEDWSGGWGHSEVQWHAYLLPRLHAFLPVRTLLEIAPGTGRWTQYLRRHCERLVGVDLAPNCVRACEERFAADPASSFYVNDGKSLPMDEDGSVDLVFSFDSLVHVEADVIRAYLAEIRRVLVPDGIAFLHHSNMASHEKLSQLLQAVQPLRKALKEANILNTAWRGLSVDASRVEAWAEQNGLACISQEQLNWGNEAPPLLNDVVSVITPRGSRWERPNRVWKNDEYMRAIRTGKRIAELYGRAGFSMNGEQSRPRMEWPFSPRGEHPSPPGIEAR